MTDKQDNWPLPEPYGWVAGGTDFFKNRDAAIKAAEKTSCIEVYSRPQILGVLNPPTYDLSGAESCDQCGTVTARLDGDGCAKWCCMCGAKLTGNYVSLGSVPVGFSVKTESLWVGESKRNEHRVWTAGITYEGHVNKIAVFGQDRHKTELLRNHLYQLLLADQSKEPSHE